MSATKIHFSGTFGAGGTRGARCEGLGTSLVVIALGGPEGKKKKGKAETKESGESSARGPRDSETEDEVAGIRRVTVADGRSHAVRSTAPRTAAQYMAPA